MQRSKAKAASAAKQARSGDGGGAGRAGPTIVKIPGSSYCIDSTEVSFADYRASLAVADVSAPLRPGCAWNTSFEIMSEVIGEPKNHPIRGVDWCDAVAYCEWAGKRLCGRIGGGSVTYDEFADAIRASACAAAPPESGRAAMPAWNALRAAKHRPR